jgi:hypothetical protein
MATKGALDAFPNYAIAQVVESAANTLTFKKIESGISLNEKVAWIIHRIEYYINAWTSAQFNTDADAQTFGISRSNSFTQPSLYEASIVDEVVLQRVDLGTAASGFMTQRPWIRDFTMMPGGGLLVSPIPLYLFAMGTGLVGASTTTAKIYYSNLELSTDEYWQLLQTERITIS